MQDTQFCFCMISLHQKYGTAYVSIKKKKKKVLKLRNVKGTPSFMQLFPRKQK